MCNYIKYLLNLSVVSPELLEIYAIRDPIALLNIVPLQDVISFYEKFLAKHYKVGTAV